MKPPPPIFPAAGYVTARANAVATAASTALPPCFIIETPTSEAGREIETTTPCWQLISSLEYLPEGRRAAVLVCAFGCAQPGKAIVKKNAATPLKVFFIKA